MLRGFVENVPFFMPALLVTILVGAGLTPMVARRLGAPRWLSFVLIMSVGLIVAATLTPLQTALDGVLLHPGTCDLRHVGLSDLIYGGLRWNDARLNVLLFVPLGVAIGLLSPSRRRLTLLGVAAVSPIVIELTQMLAVQLGRGCQLSDMVDNLMGLAIGFILGAVGTRLLSTAER